MKKQIKATLEHVSESALDVALPPCHIGIGGVQVEQAIVVAGGDNDLADIDPHTASDKDVGPAIVGILVIVLFS